MVNITKFQLKLTSSNTAGPNWIRIASSAQENYLLLDLLRGFLRFSSSLMKYLN